MCGNDELVCLSIDHVNGGGERHRRETKTKSGGRFYSWLKQNSYPPGFQTLCMNCHRKIEERRRSSRLKGWDG